jgi:hypoxanthine-DNA glycosylase
MEQKVKISLINKVINEWFEEHPAQNKILAKELMPLFITKGIFNNNHRDGLTIRNLLRDLKRKNQLGLIPHVLDEQKIKNINWYFTRAGKINPGNKTQVKHIPKDNLPSIPVINNKKSFPPIIDIKCHTLILGTIPGDISLAKGQYYANSNNHFWKIMNDIFENMPELYEERCKWLLKHGIALWDVAANADRNGSLDTAIKNARVNDFYTFYQSYPAIKRICFNGTKAQEIYNKKAIKLDTKKYILLPSSSSARAMKWDAKLKEWKNLIKNT